MATFNPGALEIRIAPLGPLACTALAAACAERVNPVYEKYWVGNHVAEVRQAIELGWQVCAGAPLDPVRLQHLEERVSEQLDYFLEEGIDILASSVTASLRVLQTLDPVKVDPKLSAFRALGSSLYVVQMAADLSGTMDEQTADNEELAWQDRALDLVSGGSGPWEATLFSALGAVPPLWWNAYIAGAEHLI